MMSCWKFSYNFFHQTDRSDSDDDDDDDDDDESFICRKLILGNYSTNWDTKTMLVFHNLSQLSIHLQVGLGCLTAV